MRWSPIHARAILVWIALVLQAGVCLAQQGSTHAVVVTSGTQKTASSALYRSTSWVVGQISVGPAQGGLFGVGVGFVNNQVVDGSEPSLNSVSDGIGGDIDTSFDPTQLCFEWDAFDFQSSIYGAQIDIGTTPGAADVLQTIVAAESSICIAGPFPGCQIYYTTLRARNGARLVSSPLTTDGVFLDDALDTDGDGLGNACDDDDDGDGLLDGVDACPCDPFNDVDADGICAGDPQCGMAVDNCPTVSNPSQFDSDMDGIGDACQSSCSLLVTPTGSGDCPTIQACINQGKTCDIVLAAGTYDEQVIINRGITLRPVGAAGSAILTNSLSGATLTIASVDLTPVVLRDLQITGSDTAITSSTSWWGRGLDVRDVTIGLSLSTAGVGTAQVTIMDSVIRDTVVAIESNNTDLKIDRSRILRSMNRGIIAKDGSLTMMSSLIEFAAADCLNLNGTIQVTVAGSTIVGCDAGINVGSVGLVTVSSTILDDHNKDILSLPCNNVSFSNLQTSCCAGNNLCLPPQFNNPLLGDYSLANGSPLIEVGTPANAFRGKPQLDLTGQPRLLDSNHDGFSVAEMGAIEKQSLALNRPDEVTGVQFAVPDQMDWDPEAMMQFFRVYRGSISTLTYFTNPACLAEIPSNSISIFEDPLPGAGFFFLVSSVNAMNIEGTVGFGSYAERSAIQTCP